MNKLIKAPNSTSNSLIRLIKICCKLEHNYNVHTQIHCYFKVFFFVAYWQAVLRTFTFFSVNDLAGGGNFGMIIMTLGLAGCQAQAKND